MITALVLLSGGLDSATLLSYACRAHGVQNVSALSFDYGQSHRKELESAVDIADELNIDERHYRSSGLDQIFQGGSSALFHEVDMPDATYDELHEAEGPSPTYVPFRNAVFISIATAKALTLDIDLVYAAMHADDAHNWAYPDCTPEFIGGIAAAVYIGTYHRVRLAAPLMWLSKADVVRAGHNLDTPFELTWSCYEGGNLHCGICPACRSRKHAFVEAEVTDPTVYAV